MGDMNNKVLVAALLVVLAASAQARAQPAHAPAEERCPGCRPGTKPQHPQAGIIPSGEGRIIGGDRAGNNQFPWFVLVQLDTYTLCGGSLISEEFVLTAAHCVSGFPSFLLSIGAYSSVFDSNTTARVATYKKTLHPDFSESTLSNDIALLQLLFPVAFNDGVVPIKLPSVGTTSTFEGQVATVTGYGKRQDDGPHSIFLKYVQQPVMANKRCARFFGDKVGASTVCADGEGVVGACDGDMGGPLAVQGADGVWLQIGVVSFVSDVGCQLGYPTAATRVTAFLKWIEDQTNLKF